MALLGALAWRVVPLRELLDEHLEDNQGEVLPHPLMSQYERWAERALAAGDTRLGELLALLEEAYAFGGGDVEELISVSFLEHLPRPGDEGSELREMLGPTLRQQLRVIG